MSTGSEALERGDWGTRGTLITGFCAAGSISESISSRSPSMTPAVYYGSDAPMSSICIFLFRAGEKRVAWAAQMLTAADLADESTDLMNMTMAVELAARWGQRPFLVQAAWQH